jgi:flagellar export protein FliJ
VKAFRFRAQAVLDLRSRRRDLVQTELALAERAEQAAAADLESAERRKESAETEGATALRAGGPVSEFERHRNWIAHLRAESDRLRTVRHERAAEVAAVRERLRTAHQEVRVLERLRDQRLRSHQESVRQEDMRDLNEVATMRFTRQRSQEGSTRDS